MLSSYTYKELKAIDTKYVKPLTHLLFLTFDFFYLFYNLLVIILHINTSLLIAFVVGVIYVLPFGSMLTTAMGLSHATLP